MANTRSGTAQNSVKRLYLNVGMSLKDFNCTFDAWEADISENRAKGAGRVD